MSDGGLSQVPAFVDTAIACLSKLYESMMITEESVIQNSDSSGSDYGVTKSTSRVTSRVRDLAESEVSLRNTCCEVLESYILNESTRFSESFSE